MRYIPLNEVVEYEGELITAVPYKMSGGCSECFFLESEDCFQFACSAGERPDNENVIFLKVEPKKEETL